MGTVGQVKESLQKLLLLSADNLNEFGNIEEITKEINEANDDYKTIINSLDQFFFNYVSNSDFSSKSKNENLNSSSSSLELLLSLYQKATTAFNASERNELILWNLCRFSLSYSAIALTVPGIFKDKATTSDLVELFVGSINCRRLVGSNFFKDWTDVLLKQNEDFDTFDNIMSGIIHAIFLKMKEEKLLSNEIQGSISILAAMCQIPEICKFIIERSEFFKLTDTDSSLLVLTPQDTTNTFLGSFWSCAAVDSPDNFDALKVLLPPNYTPPIPFPILQSAFDTIREAQNLLTTVLHENIILSLMKSTHAPTGRQAVLNQFASIAVLNKNRAKLQADATTINSDGFIMNSWALLLKLCDPFTVTTAAMRSSKIALIDVNYIFQDNFIIKWTEFDRLALDPVEFEEFVNASLKEAHTGSKNYNFITQIFFITLLYFKLGPLRLIQEYGSTSREFNEIEQEMNRLEESRGIWSKAPNALMIERFLEKLKGRTKELVDLRISFDLLLMNPKLKKSTLALISFYLQFYQSLPSDLHLRALPEFFFENIWEFLLFMTRVDPEMIVKECSDEDRCKIFSMASDLISRGDLIKNPYIRSKQVELFFILVSIEQQQQERNPNPIGIFSNLDPEIHSHLVPHMMEFYVQVEALGTSTAFYDKFSIRFHLTRVLLHLLSINPSLFYLNRIQSTLEDAAFVRFVNLLVSDSTYLLDESLSKLAEIRESQLRAEPLTPEEQKLLAQTERQCQSLLSLGSESLSFLARLTEVLPEPFVRPEILDRLTAMLNFNLVLLAGPRCSKLKVNDPAKYNFNPRALLHSLIEVYLALAKEDRFVQSVAADERSFSPQLFDSCLGILKRTGVSHEMVDSFVSFSNRVMSQTKNIAQKGNDVVGEEMESIPDHFLDPILFNLMVDPVKLPASQIIVDRATIQAHLLNDPHDPFNRQSLTIEQVEPVPELKAEIEQFLKSSRK